MINPLRTLKQRFFRRPGEPPKDRELAWGGTPVPGGRVRDDYNPDLQGRAAVRIAEEMRRSDAQVRSVEKVVGLPIRATTWFVEEPRGAGAAEREAAECLRENLFGGMEGSWDDLLREACLALYFGWRVPEIVWEETAGLVRIRKVAGRHPELVERWLYDPDGRLAGYLYAGSRPTGDGLRDTTSTSRYERVAVPIEKTLHFVSEGENDNPQGFGLWRSMYPHWRMKKAIYGVMNVGIERSLLGVPVGKRSEAAQMDDGEAMLTILRRLRAAPDAAITLPYGWEVEWCESRRTVMDAMPYLHHHDAKIAQAGLAQFLNLGQQQVGTQSLAETHAELFLQAEEACAAWAEQTINTQLVRRWFRLNYGPAAGLRPPVLRHRRIESRNPAALTAALRDLVTGRLLQPTPDDEAYLRDLLELPTPPKEQTTPTIG